LIDSRSVAGAVTRTPWNWLSAMVRDLTADLLATWSIRMDSTMPVVSFGRTVNDPDSTLRAAASASIASSLPTRAFVWWWVG
jgi:hypothetical protein